MSDSPADSDQPSSAPEVEIALAPPASSQKGRIMVLLAAFLGWMFDGLEQGLFPQIAKSSLQTLVIKLPAMSAKEWEDAIAWWHQVVNASYLVGGAMGGIAFGWLGDKIGRVRAMSFSILVYSLFTGLGYFAEAPWHLAALRLISAIGMGGEWSLGVALIMEVWPSRLRPILAGVIGAAPALLTFLIRLFVPESEKWAETQKHGPTAPLREAFTGKTAPVMWLAIVFASVPLLATWGAVQNIPAWSRSLPTAGLNGADGPADQNAAAVCGMLMAAGAVIACLLAPLLGAKLGRRPAYFLLCVASLAACSFVFRALDHYDTTFKLTTFVVGGISAAFYGWLPLYLPELFPTRIRATAQGIAYNVGRLLAAGGALAGGTLVAYLGGYAGMGAALCLVYVVGMIVIWFAPETKGKPLPE
jgi:SHS family sialic acid transporter-like MFS transporter